MNQNMQIILSAILHKDNLISILLCLYFHQGFTELASPELLVTTRHFGTDKEAGWATKPSSGGENWKSGPLFHIYLESESQVPKPGVDGIRRLR